MPHLPDLVLGTKLETSFQGDHTVHFHDEHSDDERDTRPLAGQETWEQTELLGQGGYGEVWLQRCIQGRRLSRLRAVKIVRLGNTHAAYQRELETIAKFSQRRYSKCFVKLLGWYDRENTVFIAMEYFPLGDLQKHMDTCGAMLESHTQVITSQILEGLQWMHQDGFAHRDIKPANILIKAQPPASRSWWVKISDFGISKRLQTTDSMTTIVGTLDFMAPEIMACEPGSQRLIDYPAADMWSLGEMVFRMLTGDAVFRNLQERFVYLAQPLKFPSSKVVDHGASDEAPLFISALMKPTPESRLQSCQALDHKWLVSSKIARSAVIAPDILSLRIQAPDSRESHHSMTREEDPWATMSATRSTEANSMAPESSNKTSIADPKRTIAQNATESAKKPNEAKTQTINIDNGGNNAPSVLEGTKRPFNNIPSAVGGRALKSTREKSVLLEHQKTLVSRHFRVQSVVFSPDGCALALEPYNGPIMIWKLASNGGKGQTAQLVGDQTTRARSSSYSPDGRLLAYIGRFNFIKLWDTEAGQHLPTVSWGSPTVSIIDFLADGRLIAVRCDFTVQIWDPQKRRCLQIWDGGGHPRVPGVITLSPAGRVAYGFQDGHVESWKPDTGECLRLSEFHIGRVSSIAFSGDGRLLASGSVGLTAKIWDPETGACLHTLDMWVLRFRSGLSQINRLNLFAVNSLAFSVDNRLATGSCEGTRIWDAETGQHLQNLDDIPTHSVAFSSDGHLACEDAGTVRVYRESGREPDT
ncbi:kinase-like domain-containing protein [Xylariomycetidae sp. FL2044]|nr:kinase-like domain-containing protein [Xylariomycetidae sp. FL2044]